MAAKRSHARGGGGHRAGLLLVLLLTVLGALALRSRHGGGLLERRAYDALEPVAATLAGLRETYSDRLADLFRRERLRARVSELEARVAGLEQEIAGRDEAWRENLRLAALLELKDRSPGQARAARVIGREASGPLRSLVIDAGARDGVDKDAAVIAVGGLVGRVLRVGERTSVVQLLTDAASGMGVVAERSRVQGVLVGSGQGECRLKYVPNLEDLKAGDRILASGLDGIYPRGALVGTVVEVAPGADAFLNVRIAPAVALASLETVLVAVRPGGQALKGSVAAVEREPMRSAARRTGP